MTQIVDPTPSSPSLESSFTTFKRYNLRTPKSPSPVIPPVSTVPSQNGFKRLKNKKHLDRLYLQGKQKQLARSQSALLTHKEVSELKNCTFQPRIKYTSSTIQDPKSREQVFGELYKQPQREKAKLDKFRRDHKQSLECTFTPKVNRRHPHHHSKNSRNRSQNKNSQTFKGRSRSVFDDLYQESSDRRIRSRKREVRQYENANSKNNFKPVINRTFKHKEKFEERLEKDISKRKQKIHKREDYRRRKEIKGCTFTPKLVSKSIPRMEDSEDSD